MAAFDSLKSPAKIKMVDVGKFLRRPEEDPMTFLKETHY